jgi:gluconate 2-dehydrogenase gamma chain
MLDAMQKIPRRSLLASAAIVPAAAIRSAAQTTRSVFSDAQKRCLEAFANRLIPRDEYCPSAVECGAVDYIDRSLAEPQAGGVAAILAGLDGVDAFAKTSQSASLADLPAEKQDAVLTAVEKAPDTAAFFTTIRRLVLEGMFCDPRWGGNRNYAGWDLIRYPGPRLAVAVEEQQIGVAVKPLRPMGETHGH